VSSRSPLIDTRWGDLDFQPFFLYHGSFSEREPGLEERLAAREMSDPGGDLYVRPEKRELFYQGRAKKLYLTDRPEFIIQEFSDHSTLPDGKIKATIKNKGTLNNQISSYLFEYLAGYHIPTHFVQQLSDSEMLVKRLEIIPFDVVVRNTVSGSLSEYYGMKEGIDLPHPIFEHYLRTDHVRAPLLNEYHILAMGLATPEELRLINRIASKVNVVLKSFFERRSLKLIDSTLEFGRHNGQVLLGDEISPDSCRFLDKKTNKKLDAEQVREDSDGIRGVYEEIRNRVFAKVA
jgi:phosphoribosylaminoimidazole-succinocarboxamide synthase